MEDDYRVLLPLNRFLYRRVFTGQPVYLKAHDCESPRSPYLKDTVGYLDFGGNGKDIEAPKCPGNVYFPVFYSHGVVPDWAYRSKAQDYFVPAVSTRVPECLPLFHGSEGFLSGYYERLSPEPWYDGLCGKCSRAV